MELFTENLVLNQITENDIQDIVNSLNNPVFSQNSTNIPYPYDEDCAKFWLELIRKGQEENTGQTFAIRTKTDLKMIGAIGLELDLDHDKAELGYWLDKNFWNKGFATEASKKIIDYGFNTLKLKRIFATHFDFNTASGKVMLKSGMQQEGVLYAHTKNNDRYENHILYAIINDQMN